jgi:hypothetical protein
MASEKPKLEWCDGGPFWEAVIPGHVELSVWKKSLEWIAETADGRAFSGSKGKPADSLLAAELAAEAAALAWLREGVEALGGRVLTSDEVVPIERETRHDAATQLRSLAYLYQEDGEVSPARALMKLAGEIERGDTASMVDDDRANKMLNREQAKAERDPLDWEC